MVRPWKVGKACGIEIALHWTIWAMPAFVLGHGLWFSTPDNALLNVAVLLAVYLCVLLKELAHALVADRFGIGTRDVLLYPVCGIARLTRIGERPKPEIWIALAGPVVHILIPAALWLGFYFSDIDLQPHLDRPQPYLSTFFNRLFWSNVVLTVVNLLPVLPFDGGRIFRAALALSTTRLRATEVTALLSAVIALTIGVAGIFWLESPLAVALSVFIYLLSQQELIQARTFASIHASVPGTASPTAVVPVDQIIDEECRPAEPNFSGFTWNQRARLWIEWKNGEPISANALIGE